MRKQIFIALFAIVALGTTSASAQECCNNTPYVEVRGSASTTIEANKIEVNIALSEADSKGKVKLSELESQLASALKKAGIDAKTNLVITSQSSNAAKKSDIYQYKNYMLTLSSAEQLATVFEAFAEFSVANANVGRIWNDKQAQYEAQVKVAAVENAKANATILATAAGQTIGNAILIQDYSSSPTPMDGNNIMMARSKSFASESLPDDLSMRKINIVQSITVRFILLTK